MDTARRRAVERKRRALRVRKKIFGTAERPRLCVRRSLSHIYAQLVDDTAGRSLAQVSSVHPLVAEKRPGEKHLTKTEVSKLVGEAIAERAKAQGIQKVVFDRKGHAYCGRVKALAEAARGKGLLF
jgi:large subunit ribosomal protein L18